MGDSPEENFMKHDIITDWKTKMTWATDSKDDVSLYTEGVGEGVETDIPDSEDAEHVDSRTTASDDNITFVKNSYCNSEETSSTKITAPLMAYSKLADVVLHSERPGEDIARPGVSGQRENEGRGKVTDRHLKKGLIQSILSTLGNKRRFQRAVPPPTAREEAAASATAGGNSNSGRSFLRALHQFSMSWRSGVSRAQEHTPTQVPTARSETSAVSRRGSVARAQEHSSTQMAAARSDTSAARRSVAMIEKVGSRLHSMQQILQAHHAKGRNDEEDEIVFQKVVKELRSQLSDAEVMIAEIAPLVGKKNSNPELLGTLEMMTTKLLELREVLQIGPTYSGSFSQLDVQAAFIDARNRLKEAQYAASKLGPIAVIADK